jgi:hypothetical protein
LHYLQLTSISLSIRLAVSIDRWLTDVHAFVLKEIS